MINYATSKYLDFDFFFYASPPLPDLPYSHISQRVKEDVAALAIPTDAPKEGDK